MAKDAPYIIDICDRVLGTPALREYRFDFLRGDPGRNGRVGATLPVDAYYPALNLVIEYCERQHAEPVPHFDKPNVITVSGVHRGLQRALYDQRRRDFLPKPGITLIELHCSEFKCKGSKRLRRLPHEDEAVIRNRLVRFCQRNGRAEKGSPFKSQPEATG
jgi:hypothetical protein